MELYAQRDLMVLVYGAAAFTVIVVPAMLFVGAFALGFPTVLGTPLFRVLFIGYWFWGNAVPPTTMPTLNDTWLSPVGRFARLGFFGNGGGFPDLIRDHASVWEACGSVTLLLAVALVALLAVAVRETRLRARR